MLAAQGALYALWTLPVGALISCSVGALLLALRALARRFGERGRLWGASIREAQVELARWRAQGSPERPWEASWESALRGQERVKLALMLAPAQRWALRTAGQALVNRPSLGGFAARAGWNPIELIRVSGAAKGELFEAIAPLAETHWRAPLGCWGALRAGEMPWEREKLSARRVFCQFPVGLSHEQIERLDRLLEARLEREEINRELGGAMESRPRRKAL